MPDARRAGDDRDDDAALRWDGDEELGRMTSLDEPRIGGRAAPAGADTDADEVPDAEAGAGSEPPALPRDRALTAGTAAFAVLYLVETVGWIFVLQGVQSAGLLATGSGLLDFIGGIARFLALVAAPLWFVATVQLTRELRMRRRVIRIGWLALGAGLLVPWPLLLGLVR